MLAVCLVPVAAFVDAAEIRIPPSAANAPSSWIEGEVHFPPGFSDTVLLVWVAARIGPPIG